MDISDNGVRFTINTRKGSVVEEKKVERRHNDEDGSLMEMAAARARWQFIALISC